MNIDDDVGSSEYWHDIKQCRQIKRAENRVSSAAYLTQLGINFVSKNMDAHLIVSTHDFVVDFWPGTGRWICRTGKKGFGVKNLVAHIERKIL